MHRQVTTGREWEDCYLTWTIKEEQTRGSQHGSLWKSVQKIFQETFTDYLNSGSARSAPLDEGFRGAATRGTAVSSNHPSQWTDNRGNGSVQNTLLITRYPSSALVMELAAEMKKNRVKTLLQWTPREFNREADALAN